MITGNSIKSTIMMLSGESTIPVSMLLEDDDFMEYLTEESPTYTEALELSKILPAIADGLTVASNNWFDDYSYGHLTPEDDKLYETWRTLIDLIRRK